MMAALAEHEMDIMIMLIYRHLGMLNLYLKEGDYPYKTTLHNADFSITIDPNVIHKIGVCGGWYAEISENWGVLKVAFRWDTGTFIFSPSKADTTGITDYDLFEQWLVMVKFMEVM